MIIHSFLSAWLRALSQYCVTTDTDQLVETSTGHPKPLASNLCYSQNSLVPERKIFIQDLRIVQPPPSKEAAESRSSEEECDVLKTTMIIVLALDPGRRGPAHANAHGRKWLTNTRHLRPSKLKLSLSTDISRAQRNTLHIFSFRSLNQRPVCPDAEEVVDRAATISQGHHFRAEGGFEHRTRLGQRENISIQLSDPRDFLQDKA